MDTTPIIALKDIDLDSLDKEKLSFGWFGSQKENASFRFVVWTEKRGTANSRVEKYIEIPNSCYGAIFDYVQSACDGD